MKAVYITEQGGLDVLQYGDLPEPEIGPDEVKIRVRATALNHLDVYTRAGVRGTRRELREPLVLGIDIAGEVAAVGEHVFNVRPGDRVAVNPVITCGRCEYCVRGRDNLCVSRVMIGTMVNGGYAEYAKAPWENVLPIPDGMSYEEACGIPLVAMTAYHMLVTRAGLQPGDDVLVMAAGSGVGSVGIQIAKALGARVIATAGTDEKAERGRQLGADHVINYRANPEYAKTVRELTGGKGVDIVFDHVGAAVWEQNIASLKPGGVLVNCGVTSGYRMELQMGYLFTHELSVLGSELGTKAELARVMKLVRDGKVRGVVSRTFPLQEAREAHRAMEERDHFGKLVLVP